MIKIVMFVRRRRDISTEQFREHYETVHAPLAQSLFRSLRAYRRSYPDKVLSGGEPSFDAITELYFDDEAGFRETVTVMSSPAGKALQEDEEKFMDRPATTAMLVTEAQSTFPAS